MKATEKIKKALDSYASDTGKSGADIARDLGVSVSTVCNWKSGKSKAIKRTNWEKLQPILARFLSPVPAVDKSPLYSAVADCEAARLVARVMVEHLEVVQHQLAGKSPEDRRALLESIFVCALADALRRARDKR